MSTPFFNAHQHLRRFVKVFGIVSQSRGLNISLYFNFRGVVGNAERNSRMLLLALQELSCPYRIETHCGPVKDRVVKRDASSSKPRARLFRTVTVRLTGGLYAAAWVREQMRGECGNERKDRLLNLARTRKRQIDAIIVQRDAALIARPEQTPVDHLLSNSENLNGSVLPTHQVTEYLPIGLKGKSDESAY